MVRGFGTGTTAAASAGEATRGRTRMRVIWHVYD